MSNKKAAYLFGQTMAWIFMIMVAAAIIIMGVKGLWWLIQK